MDRAPGGVARTFSSIDDSLNLLLDDLRPDGHLGGPAEGPGRMPSIGFAPLMASHWPLDAADAVVTASAAPFGAAAARKGSPQPPPTSFIPVPGAAKLQQPGAAPRLKLRPHSSSSGGGAHPLLSPSLQLPHPGVGLSFSIHAYGRPLTQLDFISTDDLDDELPSAALAAATPRHQGILPPGAGGGGLGGDASDPTGRLGMSLPSMEDLRRMMFDPLSPFEQLPEQHLSGYSLGRATGTGATPPGAQLAQFVPAGPHAQHAQHAAYMQPTAVVHSGGGYSVVPAALGPGAHPLLLPGVVHVRGEPHQVALHLGAQLEGAASSGLRRSLGSLGSMKRRVDGMGLSDSEADTLSPRGSKRHSSGSMWSEGSGENGGSAGTPRSQPVLQLRVAGAAHSRFAPEQGTSRQRPSRSSADSDPPYAPIKERASHAAGSRQHHLPQPQWGGTQPHFRAQTPVEEEEEAPAQPQQQYRGVSRHRLTQRWEASLWLNGRQLYLGGFNSQEDAAHAYDLAALACKGLDAQINFAPSDYADQLREIAGYTRDEVVAYVRRRSSAFSRGKSRFRGVSGHNGRWEARIGSFGGRKNVSFGVFESEEDAARQYDRALILEKGRIAKTNFPMRDYEQEVDEYEAHLAAMCGATRGPATHAVAAEYTLPRHREATADEKKRSAVIYGEALRQALAQPAPPPPRAARR